MGGWRRSAFKVRVVVAALTVAAHVLFVVLLWLEREPLPRIPATPRELEGTWIRLMPFPLPPPPDLPAAAPEISEDLPVTPRREVPPTRPEEQPSPRTAITLPSIAGPSEVPSPALPAADIKWHAQADVLAARRAQELDEAAQGSFSPPPKVLREACKPPVSSFEWKADQKKTGGSAALTLGWEPPPPNKHLFDDMKKKGQKPTSSVPDPNVCD
jgi:hypothetical protein